MELRLTWSIPEDATNDYERRFVAGEEPDLLEIAGFGRDELAAIERDAPMDVRASQKEGSVGKGAAGYGITLILELKEVIGPIADVATLLTMGHFIIQIIRRRRATAGAPTISHPETLAAVAAASLPPGLSDQLTGCYARTVPLSNDGTSGTDARDIWATCFDCDGSAIVVFMSPSGFCLGVVSVPAEWGEVDGEYRARTPDEIRAWWVEHNGGS